ncbi:nitroreductase family deazaflavin-dependent oxidoreductase [Mumia sp. zg.B53]|uniref:nitroreductase family deazaflavin-dependent oxidoreductase n=1 Tax=unclassified Mumia TaxID=2621872 RepID=UPI001C6F2FBB|nr:MULTISPECIES: nitroreductase family deazaflavin-dependent oxidoreductase [unclassified Mumia]MBW9207333.1 nitroreductase family deazaflavin-dependent oxidoreductase [Mumia sp. zg.B17]MBW9210319.1 nitroreductase family deazaflavin-dependent oxidoreductase [Mumia sp. zg.B21]MBW9214935.1 nitroreductase family deazaflavin-dependent oxidoreductase [Mumia sp. zg.B53]MDD9347341.1 nitroreductase family deazaflavin-dependent oxidoreductase [Mumia sp.]
MSVTGEYEPSPSARVRKHVEEMETTGRPTETPLGLPIVVMTFQSRRSHKVHKTAVMKVEHDGSYALVASKGGAPQHPQWYHALTLHPDLDLQDGTEKYAMRVRELHGDERAQWWERAVEAYPPYADYQRKTDREIPVLLAEPVAR